MLHSLDTSALITGRRDLFPPETSTTVWEGIESMIWTGDIRCVDEVRFELGRRDDEVTAWAKSRSDLFVPLTSDVQQATRQVLEQHPQLLGPAVDHDTAAPFVIGLALAREGTVVTGEAPSTRSDLLHVPDACAAMGIRWLDLTTFAREQGWA